MIKSIFKTLLLHFINFEYTDIIQISIISFVPFLSFSISLNWCLGLSIKAYSVLLSDNLLVKAKVDILYSTRLYRPVYFALKKSNIDKHIISFNQSTSGFQEKNAYSEGWSTYVRHYVAIHSERLTCTLGGIFMTT